MKRDFVFLLAVMVVLGFSNFSQAQFPCWPGDSVETNCCGADSGCGIGTECGYSLDLGRCDTLHVVPWPKTDTCFGGDCVNYKINTPGEYFPCFLYVSLFVTHDSNTFWWTDEGKWVQDSISAFVIPLNFWHTRCADKVVLPKPAAPKWYNNNDNQSSSGRIGQSIFRNFVNAHIDPPETTYNRMLWMGDNYLGWAMRLTDIDSLSCAGDTGHGFLSLIPGDPSNRVWWEGDRVLLATWTFIVYRSAGCDTVEICMDSTLWPPHSHLTFTRKDGKVYRNRHELPLCFLIHEDTVEILPPTDLRWIEDFEQEDGARPTTFFVSQNYPNPFNPVTNFRVTLPHASHVKIEIFNILGQKVKTLLDEDMRAGVFVVDWDGTDGRGLEVSSGIYFYRIKADDFSDIKKMVLLK